MEDTVRVHLYLSKSVLDEIDALVGHGNRSQYLREALDQWQQREHLHHELDAGASTHRADAAQRVRVSPDDVTVQPLLG